MKVNIKKLDSNAVIPTRGSSQAAGYDLYAAADSVIAPGGMEKIGTGLALEIPPHYFGAIFARSGLASKNGLRPANCVGVIDSDYRGEIIVALYNDSAEEQQIHTGDRVAQLVLLPYATAEFREMPELTQTVRSAGGFGSTGTRVSVMPVSNTGTPNSNYVPPASVTV